jgi:tetratricopeptide (TPR) repeat protein
MKTRSILRTSMLSFLIALLFPFNLLAQDDISIYGVVRDYNDKQKIPNVTISVFENGKKIFERKSNLSGKYDFILEFDKLYRIEYSYPNYVTKFLTMDVTNIPEEDRVGGLDMNIDMTLFRKIEGMDVSLLDNPIGKASYDFKRRDFYWDMAYTQAMHKKIEEMMEEHQRRLDDEEAMLAARQKEFDDLVRKGDEAVRQKEFNQSIGHYTGALAIYPDNVAVQEKLENAKQAQIAYASELAKEEEYASLIQQGDANYSNKSWENAKSNYQAALSIKPDESYPKNRIASIEELLAKQADQLRIDQEIEALMLAASKDVDNKQFDEGIGKYEQVLVLRSDHLEARDKLNEAKRLKKAFLDEQAINQQYKQIIAQADDLFSGKEYQNAIDKYQDASDLKPDEAYPANRIKEAEELLSLLAAEEAKRKSFMEWVSKGDNAVTSKEYETGISHYERALDIIPDDAEVVAKRDRARNLLDEQLAALAAEKAEKERNEKFANLVQLGDQSMEQKEYNPAIDYFEQALEVKPDNAAVLAKIARAKEAIETMKAQQERDAQYESLIASADSDYSSKSYQNARRNYQEALTLKPDEQYPANRVEEIDLLLMQMAQDEEAKQQAELDKQFNDLVFSGDKYIQDQKFILGIQTYEDALDIKPGDSMVLLKIKEARSKQQKYLENEALEKQFNDLVARADNLFNKQQWKESKTTYQEALQIKNDPYPLEQIQKIEDTLERLALEEDAKAAAEKEARFAQLELEGDDAVNQSNYSLGIDKYDEALTLIPNNQRVMDKRANALKLIEETSKQEEIEAEYSALIAAADGKFDDKAYTDARSLYQKSLQFKPKASYPKNRIDEIDLLLLKMQQDMEEENKQNSFDALVADGDRAMQQKDYPEAISAYGQALGIFPDNKPVNTKKKNAEALYASLLSQNEIDQQYDQFIDQADNLFKTKSYAEARPIYQKAYGVKANQYPMNQIKKIDQLLIEIERAQAMEEAKRLADFEGDLNTKWENNASDESSYLAEAEANRNKAQTDKYAELLVFKEGIRSTRKGYQYRGNENARSNLEQVEADKNVNNVLYDKVKQQDYQRRLAEVEMVKAMDKDWKKEQNDLHYSQIQKAKVEKEQYATYSKKHSSNHRNEILATYAKDQEIKEIRYKELARNETMRLKNIQWVNNEKEDWAAFHTGKSKSHYASLIKEVDKINAEQENLSALKLSGDKHAEKQYAELNSKREMYEVENSKWQNNSKFRRDEALNNVHELKGNPGKIPEAYYTSGLSQTYSQGVTEETFFEGKNQIVRRVVVDGNKADDYRMVVSNHGTYYFKNGNSISQQTWKRDTEQSGLD